jgi:hypothetical protein
VVLATAVAQAVPDSESKPESESKPVPELESDGEAKTAEEPVEQTEQVAEKPAAQAAASPRAPEAEEPRAALPAAPPVAAVQLQAASGVVVQFPHGPLGLGIISSGDALYTAMVQDMPRSSDGKPGAAEQHNMQASPDQQLTHGLVVKSIAGQDVRGKDFAAIIACVQEQMQAASSANGKVAIEFADLEKVLAPEKAAAQAQARKTRQSPRAKAAVKGKGTPLPPHMLRKISMLSVKQLKNALDSRDIGYEDLYEKTDLIARLASAPPPTCSLIVVLRDPGRTRKLGQVLAQNGALADLEFWLSVESFREVTRKTGQGSEAQLRAVCLLYDEFVKPAVEKAQHANRESKSAAKAARRMTVRLSADCCREITREVSFARCQLDGSSAQPDAVECRPSIFDEAQGQVYERIEAKFFPVYLRQLDLSKQHDFLW